MKYLRKELKVFPLVIFESVSFKNMKSIVIFVFIVCVIGTTRQVLIKFRVNVID